MHIYLFIWYLLIDIFCLFTHGYFELSIAHVYVCIFCKCLDHTHVCLDVDFESTYAQVRLPYHVILSTHLCAHSDSIGKYFLQWRLAGSLIRGNAATVDTQCLFVTLPGTRGVSVSGVWARPRRTWCQTCARLTPAMSTLQFPSTCMTLKKIWTWERHLLQWCLVGSAQKMTGGTLIRGNAATVDIQCLFVTFAGDTRSVLVRGVVSWHWWTCCQTLAMRTLQFPSAWMTLKRFLTWERHLLQWCLVGSAQNMTGGTLMRGNAATVGIQCLFVTSVGDMRSVRVRYVA